jgi:hypothetical protein
MIIWPETFGFHENGGEAGKCGEASNRFLRPNQ